MNVIWLASWFPNRTEPSVGDFIERHAQAVAPFLKKLIIITVVKDAGMPVNKVETIVKKQGNIEVHIVYYGKGTSLKPLEKIVSLRRNLSLYQQTFKSIVVSNGMPDLLHVQVAMKAGLFAKKIKKQYNIPYLVTEHSSIYYREAKPSIFDAGFYFRRFTRHVLRNANLVLPVSKTLGEAINRFAAVPVEVVPNVVDTNIFFPAKKDEQQQLKLIHVSGMEYPKNMETIIAALKIVEQQGLPFQMLVYGPLRQHVTALVQQLDLEKHIIFKGEVPQQQLVADMQQADALILYSRYETFGCVLIEANACGTPVIVSDLPVFHELVEEGVNGVFAAADDAGKLSKAVIAFAADKHHFNQSQIAMDAADKFSYQKVGQQLIDIYKKIVEDKKANT